MCFVRFVDTKVGAKAGHVNEMQLCGSDYCDSEKERKDGELNGRE